jgi:hypothetical protein
LLTDHDTFGARRDGWEGMHEGVLLIVGTEVSPKQGHYLAFGVAGEIRHAGRSAGEIAAAFGLCRALGRLTEECPGRLGLPLGDHQVVVSCGEGAQRREVALSAGCQLRGEAEHSAPGGADRKATEHQAEPLGARGEEARRGDR